MISKIQVMSMLFLILIIIPNLVLDTFLLIIQNPSTPMANNVTIYCSVTSKICIGTALSEWFKIKWWAMRITVRLSHAACPLFSILSAFRSFLPSPHRRSSSGI
jgi:hypothetical protein